MTFLMLNFMKKEQAVLVGQTPIPTLIKIF
jgi:hypothetical protein